MSIELMNRVWHLAVSSSHKLLLLALADAGAGDDDDCIWLTPDQIAKKTSFSNTDIQSMITELGNEGLVKRLSTNHFHLKF